MNKAHLMQWIILLVCLFSFSIGSTEPAYQDILFINKAIPQELLDKINEDQKNCFIHPFLDIPVLDDITVKSPTINLKDALTSDPTTGEPSNHTEFTVIYAAQTSGHYALSAMHEQGRLISNRYGSHMFVEGQMSWYQYRPSSSVQSFPIRLEALPTYLCQGCYKPPLSIKYKVVNNLYYFEDEIALEDIPRPGSNLFSKELVFLCPRTPELWDPFYNPAKHHHDLRGDFFRFKFSAKQGDKVLFKTIPSDIPQAPKDEWGLLLLDFRRINYVDGKEEMIESLDSVGDDYVETIGQMRLGGFTADRDGDYYVIVHAPSFDDYTIDSRLASEKNGFCPSPAGGTKGVIFYSPPLHVQESSEDTFKGVEYVQIGSEDMDLPIVEFKVPWLNTSTVIGNRTLKEVTVNIADSELKHIKKVTLKYYDFEHNGYFTIKEHIVSATNSNYGGRVTLKGFERNISDVVIDSEARSPFFRVYLTIDKFLPEEMVFTAYIEPDSMVFTEEVYWNDKSIEAGQVLVKEEKPIRGWFKVKGHPHKLQVSYGSRNPGGDSSDPVFIEGKMEVDALHAKLTWPVEATKPVILKSLFVEVERAYEDFYKHLGSLTLWHDQNCLGNNMSRIAWTNLPNYSTQKYYFGHMDKPIKLNPGESHCFVIRLEIKEGIFTPITFRFKLEPKDIIGNEPDEEYLPVFAEGETVESWFSLNSAVATPTPNIPSEPTPVPTRPSKPVDEISERVNLGRNRDYRTSETLGDPISAGSGAYTYTLPLFSLGGPMDFETELIYRSDFDQINGHAGLPTPFWWTPFTTAKVAASFRGDQFASFQLSNGNHVSFIKEEGEWRPARSAEDIESFAYNDNGSPIPYQMHQTDAYLYLMDPIEERVYIFERVGGNFLNTRIKYILDRNGNRINIVYSSIQDVKPSGINDGLGRELALLYTDIQGFKFLSEIIDLTSFQLRSYVLNYTFSDDGSSPVSLSSVRDRDNKETFFEYRDGFPYNLLTRVVHPKGNSSYTQTYDLAKLNGLDEMRVINQENALGNQSSIDYDPDASIVTHTRPDGELQTYEHFSHHSQPKSITHPDQKSIFYSKNENEQLISVSSDKGQTTSFEYHAPSGKLASITLPSGESLQFTFTEQTQIITNPDNNEEVAFTFYNLTKRTYPDGSADQFVYDDRGNMITFIDPAAEEWKYAYNSQGLVTSITNPLGGITVYAYYDDGNLESETDADGVEVKYQYGNNKRLTNIEYADFRRERFIYDANDRMFAYGDVDGNIHYLTYDDNNNLIELKDPNNQTIQMTYNEMDWLTVFTDRRDHSWTYMYDNMERLKSITNPMGITTSFGYNTYGDLNRLSRGDSDWKAVYDDEGNISTLISPDQSTITFERNHSGLITQETNPLGHSIQYEYDDMNRLTQMTNPLNVSTTYGYDSVGRLNTIQHSILGSINLAWNAMGNLIQLTDLNSNNWSFSYTSQGRLKNQTDPFGNRIAYQYDELGQLNKINHPDNKTLSINYDPYGNIQYTQHSDGTSISFTYNELQCLTETKNLTLAYDADENITETKDGDIGFSASYDKAGKLSEAGYNNDAFMVNYTYDSKTGLLTKVSDTLTKTVIDLTYDVNFRLINMNRTNGIETNYTYDTAGQITRIQEGNFIDLQFTYNPHGQIVTSAAKMPLNPWDAISKGVEEFVYDNASQIKSAGYAYDKQGRLTNAPQVEIGWNGLSQITKLNFDTFDYNGNGDLISQASSERSLHYYYNYAFPLSPLMTEYDTNAKSFTRYYVWTPAGQLLYMIDAQQNNAVYYYHFDQAGSTLALTDQSGNVTDSYAYTPYGMLLAQQGDHLQPFTYNGRGGVRQLDPKGRFYHMRARVYDAQSGRFVSREEWWPQLDHPILINPYQYALDDPVNQSDITGNTPVRLLQTEIWSNVSSNIRTPNLSQAESPMKTLTIQSQQTPATALDDIYPSLAGNSPRKSRAGQRVFLMNGETPKVKFLPPTPKKIERVANSKIPNYKTGDWIKISTKRTAVRKGKKFWSKNLQLMRQGDHVKVIEDKGKWIKVITIKGTIGWIHKSSVGQKKLKLSNKRFSPPPMTGKDEYSLARRG